MRNKELQKDREVGRGWVFMLRAHSGIGSLTLFQKGFWRSEPCQVM